jgi:hypothetical protein
VFDVAYLLHGPATPHRHDKNHPSGESHDDRGRQVVAKPTTVRTSVAASSTPRSLPRRTTRVTYTQPERQYLEHVREFVLNVERERDVFLCHAWADRNGPAMDLYEALRILQVDVWFSERDVELGGDLLRQLDSGLRVSRVGIVLVTPNAGSVGGAAHPT